MAYTGVVRLTSDGKAIGVTCPDCQNFVPLTVTLGLGRPQLIKDWSTGKTRHYEAPMLVNSTSLVWEFEQHVRTDPAAHPSFASPTPDTSVG